MKLNPYPGYETHVLMNIGGPEYHYTMEEIQATIAEGKPAPGTTITDTQIPGPDDGQQLKPDAWRSTTAATCWWQRTCRAS